MSKVSEYQAALKKDEDEWQSVGDFAKELKKTSEALLAQLREAGVSKAAATDPLFESDKQKLLKWLQDTHSNGKPRKRKRITVTHDPLEHRLIRAVGDQTNGAEYEALEYLLSAVISGEKLTQPMQELVNIVVARSLLTGALPLKKLGRPKQAGLYSVGLKAAERYWSLVDSGATYQAAVDTVSSEIHKSERHVMRLVAEHKAQVGVTLEQRTRNRDFWNEQRRVFAASGHANSLAHFATLFEPNVPKPDLTVDDYLDHLDELVDRLAVNAKPLTKKI